MTKTCDGKAVGVLIADDNGRYLMFDRNTEPWGVAPPAGHVDDHGSFEMAARKEVEEEVGLTVTRLNLIDETWRPNVCRRATTRDRVGHQWKVYRAKVTGGLNPSPRETRNVRWLHQVELQGLAFWTVAYARGAVSPERFREDPGLEPVWVQFLDNAGIIQLGPGDRDVVDQLAAIPSGERPRTIVRTFHGPRPEIVVLCGSTRFADTFCAETLRLTLEGNIVLSIGCDMRSDAEVFADKSPAEVAEIKANLDVLHKRKIDLADRVRVLNCAGYIGESTRGEIAYAMLYRKPVEYLVPESQEQPQVRLRPDGES